MIGGDELYEIKKASQIETAEEKRRKQLEAERLRKERAAVAEARKDRIRSMEATRIAHLPKSQLEQEEDSEKERRRAMAAAMRDEAQDDVKKMNSILNYAITVTIRDRQLAEKRDREAAEKAATKMRELLADIEVLEQQRKQEEAEQSKRQRATTYRSEMLSQLDDALHRKRALREQVKKDEADRKAALQAVAEQERREKEEAARKKAAIVSGMLADNEQAIAAKAARRAAELALDRKADAEALERERKLKEIEEEKERQRKIREEAEFKVRGAVQKFYDDREAKEELLMRRAYEEGVRREREKALAQARKQAAVHADLKETQARMLAEKLQRSAEMIHEEKAEFERAIRVREEWLAAEKAKDEERNRANAQFLRDVQGQVGEKEQKRRAERQAERAALEAERAKVQSEYDYLRSLRDKKIEEMRAMGLPAVYQTELAKYDPERAQFKKQLVPDSKSKPGGSAPAAK